MGDVIQYTIIARDPEDLPLEFCVSHAGSYRLQEEWQNSNEISVKIDGRHVGKNEQVYLHIRSPRRFHAYKHWDDMVTFIYDVLPADEFKSGKEK